MDLTNPRINKTWLEINWTYIEKVIFKPVNLYSIGNLKILSLIIYLWLKISRIETPSKIYILKNQSQ